MKKLWIAAFALVGCTGGGVQPSGIDMLDYFPFGDNLDCLWEYAHEDVLKPYGMRGSITDWEFRDGYDFYEVSYVKDCRGQTENCVEGELIRKLQWHVRTVAGVQLAGYQTPTSNHVFDPPIGIADGKMFKGDVVSTTTGGATYTSTMDFTECPVNLETFTECAKFTIDTSDGTLDVVGDLWAINDFNVIAMDWPAENGLWQLVGHTIDE